MWKTVFSSPPKKNGPCLASIQTPWWRWMTFTGGTLPSRYCTSGRIRTMYPSSAGFSFRGIATIWTEFCPGRTLIGAVRKWRCSMPASFDQACDDGEPRRSAAAPEDAATTEDTQTATSNATARPGARATPQHRRATLRASHRYECSCSMKLLSIVRSLPASNRDHLNGRRGRWWCCCHVTDARTATGPTHPNKSERPLVRTWRPTQAVATLVRVVHLRDGGCRQVRTPVSIRPVFALCPRSRLTCAPCVVKEPVPNLLSCPQWLLDAAAISSKRSNSPGRTRRVIRSPAARAWVARGRRRAIQLPRRPTARRRLRGRGAGMGRC